MSFVFTVIRKSVWLMFSALFALSGLFSAPASVKDGALKPENEYEYLYSDGVAFCQGIATDGDYFYGTGCIKFFNYNAIVKIDSKTGEILKFHDMCLPFELISEGYSHLGDCAYYDGKIYAACEAFLFRNPAVMVFDAESLEFLDYHVLPEDGQGNGHFPWLCIKDGIIYYTQAREVDEVRMLNLSDFSYKGSLKIDKVITKITGGDIYGDTLYLSSNDGSNEKVTYSVDLNSGETKEAFIRDMGNGFTEAEGLCISENEGRVCIHYNDVLFVSKTVIRTYSVEK